MNNLKDIDELYIGSISYSITAIEDVCSVLDMLNKIIYLPGATDAMVKLKEAINSLAPMGIAIKKNPHYEFWKVQSVYPLGLISDLHKFIENQNNTSNNAQSHIQGGSELYSS